VKVPDNESALAKAVLDWFATEYVEIPEERAMRAAVKRICAMLRDPI
jgi:hypothetical protein